MASLEHIFGTEHPVALVTGSGSARVGNCVARTLAARGYRLVVHARRSIEAARTTAAELTKLGIESIAIAADVADEESVAKMVEQALAHFGRIDVLVNCAAVWERKPLEEVTADDVRRHFDINALGTFLCCRHVGLAMVAQATGGAIVNVGDWAVARPYLDYAAYFPSKGAISAMTRSLAVELATRNRRIRVNAILPGPVMLPADLPEPERRAAIEATLLKREGSPQNVADAAVMLIENDFVTGVCLPVDGGRTVYTA